MKKRQILPFGTSDVKEDIIAKEMGDCYVLRITFYLLLEKSSAV